MCNRKKGSTKNKIEGDHKTPVGEFKFKKIYYRKDKLGEMIFLIYLLQVIRKNDGWCDDPNINFTINILNFLLMQVLRNYSEMMIFMILFVLLIITLIQLYLEKVVQYFYIFANQILGTEGCIAIEKKNIIELSKKIDLTTKLIIKELISLTKNMSANSYMSSATF